MCMCYMQLELVGGPETQNTKVGPDRVGKRVEWKLSILPTNLTSSFWMVLRIFDDKKSPNESVQVSLV